MKQFNTESWNERLAQTNWSELDKFSDINEKAEKFSEMINQALDDIAPYKDITIRPQYTQGLTEKTKTMMQERDEARKKLKHSPTEKRHY